MRWGGLKRRDERGTVGEGGRKGRLAPVPVVFWVEPWDHLLSLFPLWAVSPPS